MSDKRIIDLEAKQTLGSGDYLAADSAQGTYKVDANTNIMTPLTNVRNNVANSSASPDKYSTSTAYKVGDMVIHDDILYKCTTACSAASWAVNSACFTATTLASVVTQLNSDLNTLKDSLYQNLASYNPSVGQTTFTITLNKSLANYSHIVFVATYNNIVYSSVGPISYGFFKSNKVRVYFANTGSNSYNQLVGTVEYISDSQVKIVFDTGRQYTPIDLFAFN